MDPSKINHWVKVRTGRTFVNAKGSNEDVPMVQKTEGVQISHPLCSSVVRVVNCGFMSYGQRGVNLVARSDNDMLCIIAANLPE